MFYSRNVSKIFFYSSMLRFWLEILLHKQIYFAVLREYIDTQSGNIFKWKISQIAFDI